MLAGRLDGPTTRIETWVMSCRAFSRRVEHQCLAEVFRRFEAQSIVLDFRATERNKPIQQFLASFEEDGDRSRSRISLETFQSRCPRLHHRLVLAQS